MTIGVDVILKVRENKKAGIQCDKREFEQARMKKSESGWNLVPKNIQVVDDDAGEAGALNQWLKPALCISAEMDDARACALFTIQMQNAIVSGELTEHTKVQNSGAASIHFLTRNCVDWHGSQTLPQSDWT